MKNLKILLGLLLISSYSYAQTGNPPTNPLNTSLTAASAWYRGGNNPVGPAGTNNIFGTMWNSPIYTHTDGINRMIVNGTRNATINTYVNMNTSGYIGIGNPTYGITNGNTPFFSTQGPFSLLHLNGLDGGGQEFGYRPWMKTGVTFTEGFDLSYIGNRVVNATNDINEFTLAWSNDPTNPQFGPDDMVFRFINGNGTTVSNNFSSTSDLDGLHIARFTGTGLMGLGNTFGLTLDNASYVRPQSLLHMSLDDYAQVWMQITNRLGTDQTVNDGLRLGIEGGANPPSFLRWQERTPFIVQTDWDVTAGGIANGERMRISSIGANGVPIPFGAADNNITRVAISHRGNSPITSPRSLLHLGYNTGNGVAGTFVADGWRDWMDIGTFTNNGTDNMYVGLKNEGVDRFDAVINWGDNQVAGNAPNGPDNLRFIFTSTTTALPPGQGDPVSQSNNGLETARIMPTAATTMGTNYGMMGIGDFSPAGLNAAAALQPNAKLDIDGDIRIRTVTQNNALTQILAIDPTDKNRVHWIDGNNLGSGDGNYCSQPQNPLTDNYEIPLNNFNYYFSDPIGALNQGENFVKIGDNCSTPIVAKLEVHRGVTTNTQLINIGAYVLNEDNAVNINNIGFGHGVVGNATGPNENNSGISGTSSNATTNYGGFFDISAPYVSLLKNYNNVAVEGRARNGFNNIGGRFSAASPSTSLFSIGVLSTARGSETRNFAGHFRSSHSSFSAVNYGIRCAADNGAVNYGIYASAPVAGTNRAGLFNGDVEIITGTLISDKMFKINIEDIKGATDVLRKLKPHTYKMDVSHFPQFNFQDRLQYGFIAQEVADVLPNLVHDSHMPSELDSLGNEISPAVDYKSLNYNALIPITVQAVNELNTKIDNATLSDQTVKTNVQNLSNSLDKVKQMRGVSYTFSTSAQNDMNLDSLQHIGFIAQEVAAIEPLLTFTDDSSLVHVNYDRIAPLLVESVKELDNKILVKDSIINHLQDEINTIKECLHAANICTEGHRTMNTEPNSTTNNRSVELVNTNSIILDQNLPNPFAESTVINYNIPAEVSEAKLLFYDLNGRIIKELIIDERGESKLTVYGTNLKTGVYTYSLIADGELIATKKMVKK